MIISRLHLLFETNKTVQKQLHKRKKKINEAKKNNIKRNLIFLSVNLYKMVVVCAWKSSISLTLEVSKKT